MKNRLSGMICFLVVVLAACSGNNQTTIAPVSVQSAATIAPTVMHAFTPISSDTPPPTMMVTPHTTPTASIAPTLTATPENYALAKTGFDIANVRVYNPRTDLAFIDFNYRIDLSKKLPSEDIMIGALLPATCAGMGNMGPFQVYDENNLITVGTVEIQGTSGSGRLDILQEEPRMCETPSFEMVIMFTQQVDVNNYKFRVVYREQVGQPLKVVRIESNPDFSKMASVKNFAFQATGPWSGELTFDYEIAPEYFIRVKNARFHLRGTGDILYCELNMYGLPISAEKGNYVINIDMNQYRHEDSWAAHCRDKLSQYSRLVFDQITLSLLESNDQYINFSVVLKKQP